MKSNKIIVGGIILVALALLSIFLFNSGMFTITGVANTYEVGDTVSFQLFALNPSSNNYGVGCFCRVDTEMIVEGFGPGEIITNYETMGGTDGNTGSYSYTTTTPGQHTLRAMYTCTNKRTASGCVFSLDPFVSYTDLKTFTVTDSYDSCADWKCYNGNIYCYDSNNVRQGIHTNCANSCTTGQSTCNSAPSCTCQYGCNADNSCKPNPNPVCTYTLGKTYCEGNTLVTEGCTSRTFDDCGSAKTCDPITKTCKDNTPSTGCTADNECSSNQKCVTGTCINQQMSWWQKFWNWLKSLFTL